MEKQKNGLNASAEERLEHFHHSHGPAVHLFAAAPWKEQRRHHSKVLLQSTCMDLLFAK